MSASPKTSQEHSSELERLQGELDATLRRSEALTSALRAGQAALDRQRQGEALEVVLERLVAIFVSQLGASGGALRLHDVTQRPQGTPQRRGQVQVVRQEDLLTTPELEAERDELAATGVRTVIGVPLFGEGDSLGTVSLRFLGDRVFDAAEKALAFALAQHVVVAVETSRAGGARSPPAVSLRVRAGELGAEERAARLAQANEMLRNNVEWLRGAEDLEAFVGHTLKLMTEQIGVSRGVVYLLDAKQYLHLAWVFEEGRLFPGSEARHPNANRPLAPAEYHGQQIGRGFGSPVPYVTRQLGVNEVQRAYLRGIGAKAVLMVPMVLGKQVLGLFCLRPLPSPDEPLAEHFLLLQALANQATLAVRFLQLASEARAAAAAQQEEQQARVRAESMARLAQSSRRTLEHLAANPDFDAFLGQVVRVAVEQFAAVGGSVWSAEPDGTTQLVLTLEEGELRARAPCAHPGMGRGGQSLHRRFFPGRRGEILVHDAAAIARDPVYAPYREHLARQGVRTTMTIPIFLGDSVRGALTLRFRDERRLTHEEVELAHALANQAVLAMELTRLSRAARVAAVGEERNRLARDLHDTIAQGLAAIVRQLESVASTGTSPATMQHISMATEIARESLVEARRSIRALRPPALDGRTLQEALRDLVQRAARLSSADVRWRATGSRTTIPSDVEDELLRIANEALTNAIKHAGARAIDVELALEDESVHITVRDDGAGFDTARAGRQGLGLCSMRERANRVAAVVTVASEPGSGTEVLVYWAPASSSEGAR